MSGSADVSRGTAPRPPLADALAGGRVGLLQTYADLLADAGVVRGLIGPREAPRLWERHLLNCAVVTSAAAGRATVCDVGSGAGLPGLVWAIVRPDLEITLLEPLQRRTVFLEQAVQTLGLTNVVVHRGRAEEQRSATYDVVTARAVARLDRLARWCLPLVAAGGHLVAFKGATAEQELDEARAVIRRFGAGAGVVNAYGEGVLEEPARAVVIARTGTERQARSKGRHRSS